MNSKKSDKKMERIIVIFTFKGKKAFVELVELLNWEKTDAATLYG